MEILFIIASVIVCVLNIVLFFKVWGMTNNVKGLKKFICDKTLSHNEIRISVLDETCTDEEIARLLSKNFLRESINLYKDEYKDEIGRDYVKEYASIVSFYEQMYKLRPNITRTKWLSYKSLTQLKAELNKIF